MINLGPVGEFVSGSVFLGLIAHAVNTFPTPTNRYAAWFLGVIQWFVGQRTVASNTLQGLQTDIIGVKTEKK